MVMEYVDTSLKVTALPEFEMNVNKKNLEIVVYCLFVFSLFERVQR